MSELYKIPFSIAMIVSVVVLKKNQLIGLDLELTAQVQCNELDRICHAHAWIPIDLFANDYCPTIR